MSTLLFVTGASRGLGRAIAIAFAETPLLPQDQPLQAVLLARQTEGLNATAQAMKQRRPSNLQVDSYSVDLGNLGTLESQMEPIFDKYSWAKDAVQPQHAIFINCAGATGYIGRNPTSLSEVQQSMDLNFTSKAWMSSMFVDQMHPPVNTSQSTVDTMTTVVNVSSMTSIKPTPTMALYCAASASRDMFHRVLALDHSTTADQERHSTRILNYAPGPCDTDMQAHMRQHDSLDTTVRSYCQSLASNTQLDGQSTALGGLIRCEDTAAELVQLVLKPNAFQSGDRIEFVKVDAYEF